MYALMNCSDSYPAAPASMTLMTYRFDSHGVFNLVCALHAAADGSEVESYRALHGCVVTISERFFLLSGRHSPRWEYPREEIWQAKRR